jgi:predicted small secreted protein
MKKFYILLILIGTMVSLSGCNNTVDGAQKDMNKAADEVKDATN